MSSCRVVGVNWGDEGKGRMVDLLSQEYKIVVRYQGGNNAGHTVVNEKGKFILNLLPSGILRDDTVNVMGPGMVIDVEHLYNEVKTLREGGINITPANLKISDRATLSNLLIGLNGFTIGTGIVNEELNGKNIISKPLVSDEEIKIGVITRNNMRLSVYAEIYKNLLKSLV